VLEVVFRSQGGIRELFLSMEGGVNEKERRQRRLEKNRESARECRARKKAKVLALHQQLAKLETDNLHLRLQLTGAAAGTASGGDAGGSATGPDAASPFSSLEAMIEKGASEKEIQDAIKELQERFSDYGRDRTSAFAFHLSQLKRCLLPTQTTRTMLWLMRCAMQYLSSEGEINYTTKTEVAGADGSVQTTHSTEVVELLSSLLQTIKPTKEQRKQLVSLTSIYSGAPQSGIDFSDEMIQRLGILVKDKNELLDSEMSNISRILSATQIAKFILWIDANPLIMQMLESFWPHIAVSSST
jgi:delta 1-pyrroline-5-carboxylate dehydrogenase